VGGIVELDVSSNRLTSLSGIGSLKKLRSLKATNNALTVTFHLQIVNTTTFHYIIFI
jgi:Leucine-rich repeat (LRR) protein